MLHRLIASVLSDPRTLQAFSRFSYILLLLPFQSSTYVVLGFFFGSEPSSVTVMRVLSNCAFHVLL